MSDDKTVRIRELNDAFRQSFEGGQILCSIGVSNLEVGARTAVYQAVQLFNDFDKDNDPYSEHDFGSIESGGQTFLWKIEYYDKSMEYGSEAPSDPAQTARVMTIMLAEEY